MSYADYMNTESAERILLVEITKGAKTFYLSDRPYVTEPTDTPANQLYAPIIKQGGLSRFKWGIGDLRSGRPHKNYGDIQLWTTTADGQPLSTKALRGATVTLKIAAPRKLYPYSDAQTMFVGSVSKCGGGRDKFTITLTDAMTKFDAITLPPSRFVAGGNLPATLVGKPIPMVLGTPQLCDAVLVDPTTLTYKMSDRALPNPLDVLVYDAGISLVHTGAAQGGSATTIQLATSASSTDGYYVGCDVTQQGQRKTITAYVGATRTATVGSAWTTNPIASTPYSVNLFKLDYTNANFSLLSTPTGNVKFTIATTSTNKPESINTHKDLMQWLAVNVGGMNADNCQITDVYTASGGTVGFNAGLHITDITTLGDWLSALAAELTGFWAFDRSGLFVFRLLSAPEKTGKTFTQENIFSHEWEEYPHVYWRCSFGGAQNMSPETQFAGGVSELTRAGMRSRFTKTEVSESAALKTAYPDAVETGFIPSACASDVHLAQYFTPVFFKLSYVGRIEVPLFFPLVQIGQSITIAIGDSIMDGEWIVTSIEDNLGGKLPTQVLELWR